MSMNIIGTGVGRTGTNSLKLALNQLGLGPCHHMEKVLENMPVQIPLWLAAVQGKADWAAIYEGYQSAVDWPSARFFRELLVAYPEAKFIHTERSPESWADSFGSTIYTLLGGKDEAPAEMRDWLEMVSKVIADTGFPSGLGRDELMARFEAHNKSVRDTIPAEKMLVFQVKEGWGPLCEFLRIEVPDGDFPRSNNREEFWEVVKGVAD